MCSAEQELVFGNYVAAGDTVAAAAAVLEGARDALHDALGALGDALDGVVDTDVDADVAIGVLDGALEAAVDAREVHRAALVASKEALASIRAAKEAHAANVATERN